MEKPYGMHADPPSRRRGEQAWQTELSLGMAVDAAPATLGSPLGGSSAEVGGPSRETLSALLSQHGGNVSAVARSLGGAAGDGVSLATAMGFRGEAFRVGRG